MPADVIVIGAGAAGLSAARALLDSGLSVTILEARERIGGRIHTRHIPYLPTPIELGAEFIHGEPQEILKLVDAAGLTAVEVADTQWCSLNGVLTESDFWPRWVEIVKQMREAGAPDRSFRQFIEEKYGARDLSETKRMAISFVEGFNAADSGRISLKSLLAMEKGGETSYRLLNGYDHLAGRFLAGSDTQRVKLRLGVVANEIRWKRGEVEVIASSRAGHSLPPIRAERAVITIPLGVLQASKGALGSVRFEPELKQKREAIGKLVMGMATKIALRFRKRFWEETPLPDGAKLPPFGFLYSPDEYFSTWWTSLPVRSSILTGWAGGPAAERLTLRGDDFVLGRAMDSLSHLFGLERDRLSELLVAWFTLDWRADPYARGAYSYIPVGGLDAPRQLAEPIEDTLFFAGEATDSTGQNGTVHGAIASGKRAAAEILHTHCS